MTGAILDTAALYAEGHRHGSAIVRQRGLDQARRSLWALHHLEHPFSHDGGEYAAGIIDALEGAISEAQAC